MGMDFDFGKRNEFKILENVNQRPKISIEVHPRFESEIENERWREKRLYTHICITHFASSLFSGFSYKTLCLCYAHIHQALLCSKIVCLFIPILWHENCTSENFRHVNKTFEVWTAKLCVCSCKNVCSFFLFLITIFLISWLWKALKEWELSYDNESVIYRLKFFVLTNIFDWKNLNAFLYFSQKTTALSKKFCQKLEINLCSSALLHKMVFKKHWGK